MAMGQVNWQQRRDILISIICMGIILWTVWNLVNQFIEAILLLLLSAAIAFLITPLTNFLTRKGIPRLFSTVISYIFVLVAIVLLAYLLISSLVNQVQTFSTTIVEFTVKIPDRYSAFIQFLTTRAGIPQSRINEALTSIEQQVQTFASAAVANAINLILLMTNTFLDFLIVLMVSFYLTLDGKRIRDSIFGILPKRSLSNAHLFEDALTRVVGNYIRGQLTLALIIGVAVALVCTATGLGDFAVIFGVLGFLFETIPMVGPLLASISPIIVSLLLPDPFPRTLIVIACFVVIQILESNILGPRIVGHAVGLHPVVSIMSLVVFAKLFGASFGAFGGAIGALVATPIVAAVWVVVASFYRSAHGETADQMLSHKRAPWALRMPSSKVARGPSSQRSDRVLRRIILPHAVIRHKVISVTAPEVSQKMAQTQHGYQHGRWESESLNTLDGVDSVDSVANIDEGKTATEHINDAVYTADDPT
jgi:predicted PurR-regulated permease PerM